MISEHHYTYMFYDQVFIAMKDRLMEEVATSGAEFHGRPQQTVADPAWLVQSDWLGKA